MTRFLNLKDKVILVILAGPLIIIPLPEWLHGGIFIVLMLLFGIPHGAIDHVLYFSGLKGSYKIRDLLSFLSFYLLTMLIYTGSWIFFPEFSLYFFLVASCYHFGQNQLQYVGKGKSVFLRKTMYCLWGSAILLSLLHFNADEATVLVAPISGFLADFISKEFTGLIIILIWAVWLMIFIVLEKPSSEVLGLELLEVIVLLVLFTRVSLILGFAIFFGLWHSYKAIRIEMEKLSQGNEPFSWKDFFKKSLPLTVLSVLGIILLIYFGPSITSTLSPLLLFFIAISVLTMPHMLVFERFLNKEKVV